MKKIELLAPAGSMDAAIAAVRSGANAIYLGFGDFNARRNAKNFSAKEMAEIVAFCRARGVKTHITLNTLLCDREFSSLCETVKIINEVSPDAVIVADLGVAKAFSSLAPDIAMHASTQLTVHSSEGARAAKHLGFSRVVLSRELSCDAIAEIAQNVDIEIETFVHGALCMCYSGQCYMSAFIGKRSGNRGLCAQPCRLPYKIDGGRASYPLSLKDLCLANEIPTLQKLGISSLKIEGRMKRPEYVAVVCDIYSRLIRENRTPSRDELFALQEIFSRDGFTDGYFNNKHGSNMFGTRAEDAPNPAIYKKAERLYASEKQIVPISFSCKIEENKKISLTASDSDGNTIFVEGPVPEAAKVRATDKETVNDKLSKTGGTPFFVESIDLLLNDGLSVPVSVINNLRREALDKLLNVRAKAPTNTAGALTPLNDFKNETKTPSITLSLNNKSQLSDALKSLPIERVYLPIDEIDATSQFPLGVQLPQIIWDAEWDELINKLKKTYDAGVTHALVSNVGHIAPLKKLGFSVEGDIALNVFNSRSLSEYKNLGLSRATLSPELKFAQIRDIKKCIPTEIVAYGHLPLMMTENCAISSDGKCKGFGVHTLTDRYGTEFPVLCLPKHRNLILNSDVLYLADKMSELTALGLSSLRLYFTNESADKVAKITRDYVFGAQKPPQKLTRGLYRRGVE